MHGKVLCPVSNTHVYCSWKRVGIREKSKITVRFYLKQIGA